MRFKSLILSGFTLFAFACVSSTLSAAPVTEKTSSKSGSSVIQVTGSDNQKIDVTKTGSAMRTKFFVKVYEITHYMQNPPGVKGEEAIQQILGEDNNAKVFSIRWLRKATGPVVQGAFRESFEKTLGDQYAGLKGPVDQFLSFFKEGGSVNSVSQIKWLPGGLIIVEFNGKKVGEIKDPKLANAVWQIWFGPHSVVNKLELVSQL